MNARSEPPSARPDAPAASGASARPPLLRELLLGTALAVLCLPHPARRPPSAPTVPAKSDEAEQTDEARAGGEELVGACR
ncbi:hypothetical protein ACFYQA_17820 [Streptomyces sp. NPDC005774]|uniref:hypothetical protein n=1 Tax=Streptomyces sp. NPDC005774 TaxID=3364728 RepID=UPI0036BAEC64